MERRENPDGVRLLDNGRLACLVPAADKSWRRQSPERPFLAVNHDKFASTRGCRALLGVRKNIVAAKHHHRQTSISTVVASLGWFCAILVSMSETFRCHHDFWRLEKYRGGTRGRDKSRVKACKTNEAPQCSLYWLVSYGTSTLLLLCRVSSNSKIKSLGSEYSTGK